MGPLVLAIAIIVAAGCKHSADSSEKRIEPIYDRVTGRLQLVKYDSDGDGKTDIWTYMDGPRVVRTEADTNQDGKVDRWQYYGPDKKVDKIGLSTKNDGVEDRWAYLAADGTTTTRIESASGGSGKVSRVEYLEQGVVVRVEEDTDGDGRVDKWETYDGPRLAVVGFDTLHRGAPDRRLVYGADGTVRIEIDTRGDGHFAHASAVSGSNRSTR